MATASKYPGAHPLAGDRQLPSGSRAVSMPAAGDGLAARQPRRAERHIGASLDVRAQRRRSLQSRSRDLLGPDGSTSMLGWCGGVGLWRMVAGLTARAGCGGSRQAWHLGGNVLCRRNGDGDTPFPAMMRTSPARRRAIAPGPRPSMIVRRPPSGSSQRRRGEIGSCAAASSPHCCYLWRASRRRPPRG